MGFPTAVSPESMTASHPSQHRIGDIGRLSACRAWGFDHGSQASALRRCTACPCSLHLARMCFWINGHLRDVHLDAEVAACDHDRIGCFQDDRLDDWPSAWGFSILTTTGIEERHLVLCPRAVRPGMHHSLSLAWSAPSTSLGRADEREREVIHRHCRTAHSCTLPVTLGDRGHVELGFGEVDAL